MKFKRKFAESCENGPELSKYILMKRIKPVEHYNYMIRMNSKVEKTKIVSEIGIFGITIR